jgi:hypothetical protein
LFLLTFLFFTLFSVFLASAIFLIRTTRYKTVI